MTRRVPGVTLEDGRFYYVRRVPKRLLGRVLNDRGTPVPRVRIALHTDSPSEANAKAARVADQIAAEWAAIEAGDSAAAHAHYLAARRLAEARGVPYVPMADLVGGDLEALVARVLSLAGVGGALAGPEVAAAVLGAVPPALPTLSEALPEYFDLTRTRHLKKSPAQLHRWKLSRERAVRNWSAVTGDPSMDRIARADVLKFRAWWSGRIVAEAMTVDMANKDMAHLRSLFRTYCDAHGLDLQNPFAGLSLDGKTKGEKPAFSPEWVRTKLLAPGALAALNAEAADVLLVMVNTGARPHEIIDAPLADWRLDAAVPHLKVTATERELKVAHTARDLPLLGVSLDAAKRIVARGGCTRYRWKASGWSALVGKYLRDNGLKETPAHTPYSLRHYVENMLQATGADDRVRADILGHRYERPRYGDGGALAGRRAALLKIALDAGGRALPPDPVAAPVAAPAEGEA